MTGIPYLACRNHNLNDKQKGMDVWIVFNAINITCDNWDLLLIGWTGGWMGGLYSVVARTPDPEWCAKHQCSYAQYISLLWLFLTEGRSRAGCPFLFIISQKESRHTGYCLPAYSFRLKEVWMAPINDYNLMVFVQETLNGRLGRPCDITPKPSAVAGPPEGIALAVLLGEHQQHLRKQEGMEAWVRQCWDYSDDDTISSLLQ